MRPYRGKRLDNGEWAYGYYLVIGGRSYIFNGCHGGKHCGEDSCIYLSFFDSLIEVNPVTVGQSTGLKDKNDEGEKLFHKDRVLVREHYFGDSLCPGEVGVIEWIDDGWAVVNKDGDFLCGLWDYVHNYCGGKQGNIHDKEKDNG
jgi:hypothetical protein